MLLKDFGATVLVATPSYALHIGEVVRDMGYTPEDLKLRLGLFGSEGCTEEMRTAVEESLGIFATDNYGMSELMGPGGFRRLRVPYRHAHCGRPFLPRNC